MKIYESRWIGDWYEDEEQRKKYHKNGLEILRAFYESQAGKWKIPERLEAWFQIKIGGHALRGRIDRVDRIDGGLEIIDYKTGKPKEKLDGDDKDQLLIYQIALREIPEYKELGEPKKLTFYYINNNSAVSFLGTEEEIIKLEDKISITINKILAGDFTATPSQFVCNFCDFKDICEFRP